MPFGLKNAAQTFQRLMDSALQDLDFVYCYIDDILIASKTVAQHLRHLKTLFTRLEEHGLIINLNKCKFGQKRVTFLGHDISDQGVSPLQEKVKAVRDFNRPNTVKGLQEFLGIVNYYHRFLPRAANIMGPLYSATATKDKLVSWTSELEDAFNKTNGCNVIAVSRQQGSISSHNRRIRHRRWRCAGTENRRRMEATRLLQ